MDDNTGAGAEGCLYDILSTFLVTNDAMLGINVDRHPSEFLYRLHEAAALLDPDTV